MNKKLLSIVGLVAIAALASSCGIFWLPGNGDMTTETRTVSDFTAVDFTGTGDVEILRGDACSVQVYIDSNLQEYVDVSLEGSTLVIDETNVPSIMPSADAKITITMPAITGLTFSGTGDALVSGFSATSQLDVDYTGTGNLTLSGFATTLKLVFTGTGDVEANANFSCTDAVLAYSGTGDVALYATNTISGTFTGTGNVDTYGGATVNVSHTGTGSVIQHP